MMRTSPLVPLAALTHPTGVGGVAFGSRAGQSEPGEKPMRISDIRGTVQLATQATAGVTRIVESVHQSVWDKLGVPGGRTAGTTRGVTAAVFRLVNTISQLTGKSVGTVIAVLETVFEPGGDKVERSPRGETFLSVLNGVLGDRLVEDKNPFAIPMSFRYAGQALNSMAPGSVPANAGKVVLLIHGLCMTDLHQHARLKNYASETGEVLATALGYCPVYLRYNSGLHISRNGQELSVRLEQLFRDWPGQIEELSVVAHSMGGLLIRSALWQAQTEGMQWPQAVKNIVFLGTPHHGAPLEKAGNWLDIFLENMPYTKPFAALGQLRSAGITDLRYGNLLDEDWTGHDRFGMNPDVRRIVPLPESVNCYTVAATRSEKRGILSDHLVGDGLVPLRSALGLHDEKQRALAFKDSSQLIVYRTGHLGLLNSPGVNQKVIEWLSGETLR